MTGRVAGAGAGGGGLYGGGVEGGVDLQFESADCGVEILESGGCAVHGCAAGNVDGCFGSGGGGAGGGARAGANIGEVGYQGS